MIMRIRNMRMKTKLLTAFLFVAVIMLCTLLIAIRDMRDTVALSDETIVKVVEPLDNLLSARISMEAISVEERDILRETDIIKQDAMIDDIIARITDIKDKMLLFSATIERAETLEYYTEFTETLDNYAINIIIFRDKINSGDEGANSFMLNELSPVSDECLNIMSNINGVRLDFGRELIGQSGENSKTALIGLIICSIIGLALTVIFGVYFSISISKPILKCVDIMIQAADGDFTVRLPSGLGAESGELFGACNTLIEYSKSIVANFSEVIAKLRESAQSMLTISSDMARNSKGLNEQTSSVSTVAEEFSAGMMQSANALSTASSHISAVASSIEEINSTISAVAAAAEETSTRVEQSSALVDSIQNSIIKASDSVSRVSNAFNSVADSVNEINKSILVVSEHSANAKNRVSDADEKAKNTNDIIRRLESASKQIGKIVSVISDIADQTNMLALNAAIEAADAGEAGKGFMVVANEVKELAKQTAESTDEIADQIESMHLNMSEAVGAVSEITIIINGMTEYINSFAWEINQQGKRSDQITEDSADAARRMNEISTEINRISENAQSVTKTVVDSTKGVNEIARSTAELVVGTQEIAMNSERASNNMSEINRAAKEMASGLIDISKNIQLIDEEAGATKLSADSLKLSSEELLRTANDMEELISRFKIS